MASKQSFKNRTAIELAENCGCYYCLALFHKDEIVEWVDDGITALCPKCSVDAVLPNDAENPLDANILQQIHEHWF